MGGWDVRPTLPQSHSLMKRALIPIAALAILVASCSTAAPTASTTTASASPPPTAASTTTTTVAPPASTTEPVESQLSSLAELTTPLGSAAFDPADHEDTTPDPVSISIPRLDITDAQIDPVGVAPNGDMEIPGADTVGWYRFGPEPGQDGSSVLAAHISYDGTPGVFRYLVDTEVGDLVTVAYEDGSSQTFEIVERAEYDKVDLPLDRVFAKDGAPVLTLITCGGAFNRDLRSYEDNTVAYAVPVTG